MLIVYRKSDKEILFNSGKSFVEPNGMSEINGKLAVIEQIGGVYEDYGIYRLHDIEDSEKVEEILNFQHYVYLEFDDMGNANGYNIDYSKFEEDEQERQEQELISNLTPSESEMLKAEIELSIINMILDMEVI